MRLNAGLALLVGVLLPASAAAQARLTGADVQGTVKDESGAVLPGATITATNVETGLVRTGVTAAEGRYVLPALPPGTYRISAELQGFATATRPAVVLVLGQLATADFGLKVAGGHEEVTITAEGAVASPSPAATSSASR